MKYRTLRWNWLLAGVPTGNRTGETIIVNHANGALRLLCVIAHEEQRLDGVA